MGVEYNHLGEECESRKASHKKVLGMGWDNSRKRGEKRDWNWCDHGGKILERNWSITGAKWSLRTEEPRLSIRKSEPLCELH